MSAPIQSGISPPAALISIDGQNIPCRRAWVTLTSKRKGDTFECSFPLDAAPGLNFDSTEAQVIFLSGGQSKVLIDGKIDDFRLELPARVVCVTGRDKSAALTEKRLNKQYKNKKSSEIVKDLAKDAGLSPVVSDTKDDSGKQYDQDTLHLALNKTYAETLTWLAEREGFRWFVHNNELHFEPKDQGGGGGYQLIYTPPSFGGYGTANFLNLKLSRNMSAARPHEVTVKSWHHKKAKLFEKTAKAQGLGDKLLYELHLPGMTQQQVETIAKSHLLDYIRHECSLYADLIGDLSLEITQQISVSGTGTVLDQSYEIDWITYEYESGTDASFSMSLCAKIATPERDSE